MQFLDIYPNLMVLGMYLLDCPFKEIKTSTKSQWKHCPTTPKQNLTLRWRLSSKVQTQLFDQHFPGVPSNAMAQGPYNQLPFHRGCSNCFVNLGYVLSMYGLIYLFSKNKHYIYWQMFSHVHRFIVVCMIKTQIHMLEKEHAVTLTFFEHKHMNHRSTTSTWPPARC